MNTLKITKEEIEITRTLTNKFCFQYNLEAENDQIFSYALEKLVHIFKKFDPSLGVPLSAFIRVNLKGHLLNYIRDHLYPRSMPRACLNNYVQWQKLSPKYSDPEIEVMLGVKSEVIKSHVDMIKSYRFPSEVGYKSTSNEIPRVSIETLGVIDSWEQKKLTPDQICGQAANNLSMEVLEILEDYC